MEVKGFLDKIQLIPFIDLDHSEKLKSMFKSLPNLSNEVNKYLEPSVRSAAKSREIDQMQKS